LGLTLDEPYINETPVHINGIDVLITDDVKIYAEGKLVDYIRTAYDEGFTIDRPGYSNCC
jgi:Fe-S cluster assembly iron-binding protein IscA